MAKTLHETFSEIVHDIDAIIDKAHRTQLDFEKDSVWQRLVNDLDAARVSARAVIHTIEEQSDARNTNARTERTDRRVRPDGKHSRKRRGTQASPSNPVQQDQEVHPANRFDPDRS